MALNGKLSDDIMQQLIAVSGRRFEYDANNNITAEYLVIDNKDFAKRTYTYDANGNILTISEWEEV